MPVPEYSPGFTELLERAFQAQAEKHRGGMPARIQSYDSTTQRADVAPVLQIFIDDELQELPVLRNVPVLWPAGGNVSITWPLEAGDLVWLKPAEMALDNWLATGNPKNEPNSKRRFSLSDMVAEPAAPRPVTSPLPPDAYAAGAIVMRGLDVRLGSGMASDYVALASLVVSELQAIWNVLNAHTHPTPSGPSSPPTVGVPAGYNPATAGPGAVAASKVKAE